MGEILPVCMVCGQVPDKGIAGGFFIRRKFLCERCEGIILHASTHSPEYLRAVAGLGSLARILTPLE